MNSSKSSYPWPVPTNSIGFFSLYKREMLVPPLASVSIFVKINPLARPRMNYYTRAVYQPVEMQKELRAESSHYAVDGPIDKPVIVDCYIYLKTTKITAKSNGDLDNLLKSIFDAFVFNKILSDDSIIVGTESYKIEAKESLAIIKIWSVK